MYEVRHVRMDIIGGLESKTDIATCLKRHRGVLIGSQLSHQFATARNMAYDLLNKTMETHRFGWTSMGQPQTDPSQGMLIMYHSQRDPERYVIYTIRMEKRNQSNDGLDDVV